MMPARRTIWLIILLLAGVALWLWCAADSKGTPLHKLEVAFRNSLSLRQDLAFAAVLIVAAIPACRRSIGAWLDRFRQPAPRLRAWLTLGVSLISIAYLLFTALHQHRDLFAKWHDEFMYLTQAQLLAHGRLWMHGHPLNEFFESFYLFIWPKYAPFSFPGVSLLFVPAVWLSLPKWVIPLLVSAACVGLVYRIVSELIDGVAGLLAAFFVLGLRVFRFQALMAMANVPILFFALLMIYAWLKWRGKRQLRFAALLGLAMGWSAITRPADALAAAIPVGVALFFDLRSESIKTSAQSLAAVFAGALPFILLQLVFNLGFMGSVTKLPYKYYCQLYYPHIGMGVPVYDPTLKPQTNILQKQLMYEEWLVPFIKEHQPDNWLRTWAGKRIPEAFRTCVPVGLLLVFLPVGLLGLTDRRRWVVVFVLPGFLLIYGLLTVFISQYCCLAIGAVALLILLGAEQIERIFPLNGFTRVALPGLIVVSTLFALPEITPWIVDDRGHDMPVVEKSLRLPELVQAPAIIMYKFSKGENFHEEPVYNLDVLRPDDAPVIRVHDLGDEKNKELFRYYAERQPDRIIYRLDRADPTLTPVRLGTAKELAKTK